MELSNILDCPGASVSFSDQVDLSDLRYGNCFPVPEPVAVSGSVRNTAGVLLLTGSLRAVIRGVCDRCACSYTQAFAIPLDVVLVPALANEEDEDENVFTLVGGCADLDDIARTAFVLGFSPKLLCRPDCKGLCCRCGKNLNDGPCGCRPEMDPRFAALQQLIDI